MDTVPGAEAEETETPERAAAGPAARLLDLARRARDLEGPDRDPKLNALIGHLKKLLAEGYNPIVFCRYIDTAEYVAAHLSGTDEHDTRDSADTEDAKSTKSAKTATKAKKSPLDKGGKNGWTTVVRAVTGTLSPQQRVERIEDLADQAARETTEGRGARRVLVATDCLSEGVNLQHYFDAVVHYDLAWNPTRHDQREGRVDRYGQKRDQVRVLTLYGHDNGIDGKVLEMLIKKHRQIRADLGISVSVPDESSAGVTNALIEWVLMRGSRGEQDALFGSEELGAKAAQVEAEWKSAAEREKTSRSRYAQRAIHPEEVAREVAAVRDALGGPDEVRAFVEHALAALGAVLRPDDDGFTADVSATPAGLRDALAPAVGVDAVETGRPVAFRDTAAVARGEAALVRTDPVVGALASHVLDSALDTGGDGPRPACRCGVIRTDAVSRRTTLLLVRYRFHLTLPSRNGTTQLVAEDARLLAFTGSPDSAEWLDREQALALPAARATENTDPAFGEKTMGRLLDALDHTTAHLDAYGAELAAELAESHRRVRTAAGEIIRGLKVTPQQPADILGAYVYLPAAPDADVPADSTGVALSQWVRPLFEELGFGRLPKVGEAGIVADNDAAKVFKISHRWQHVPVHVADWATGLDSRPGGRAGAVPPQSLVQECLNRTSAHLWAMVTNGRRLRLLRDSNALATASYVEFDLEAIFDGELFSDFVLLYRLLHVSRFEVAEEQPPSACWLEKWRGEAVNSGTRALDQLREGVQRAITVLGTGFLRHPANAGLRENLDVREFHAALLRLVYRMLFLFVAEDRDALHSRLDEDAPQEQRHAHERAKERYATYFSSARLRRHARRRQGSAHGDLYRALRIVLGALGDENGRPELALPALGGLFDEAEVDAPLRGLELSNEALLGAVRHLAQVRDPASRRWRWVNYRDLDAEELGSVYESLLELVPKHSAAERTFELVELAGNTRKTTGSYYTPGSLIETLLDSSLDPVIDDAVKRGEVKATEDGEPDPAGHIAVELLELQVCDPACGSGHFLVAAARRIAKRLAAVREGNPEPTLDSVRHALHEVITHCIYGVDLNPMAVELAKVSLWLEALEPGKPLGFLDAHVKHGNALIGATPALLKDGVPDAAFKPVEGDDKKYAKTLERANAKERGGQESLFDIEEDTVKVANTVLAHRLSQITTVRADSLRDVRDQEAAYRDWEQSAEYVHALHVADAWCAAFMWVKAKDAPPAVTHDVLRALEEPQGRGASAETNAEIVRLRRQYNFFHWHLEFPEVFTVPDDGTGVDAETGWVGGFDCVLGNPPWDKVDFEDKKYFASVAPSIAAISGTARRTRIAEWIEENPHEGTRYLAARRAVKSTFHFAASSGNFSWCAEGLKIKGVNSLQTDHLFAERFSALAAPKGRYAAIIPTTIATGAGAQQLFASLTQRGAIGALYGFENRKPLFPSVHSSYPFCVISLVGKGLQGSRAQLAFFLGDTGELDDVDKVFTLTPEEISLINPNTRNLPVFRCRRDARITAEVYKRLPVLWGEFRENGNLWKIDFKRLFDMTDDSALFRTRKSLEDEGWSLEGNVFVRGEERMLPLYEGKMTHHFDHRWNSFTGMATEDCRNLTPDEKRNPETTVLPRYWVPEVDVPTGETGRDGMPVMAEGVDTGLSSVGWERGWLYGWRDVCRATDERTAVPAFTPRTGVGHTFPLMFTVKEPPLVAALSTAQSSFIYDYISRQKISGVHMALMTWKQLPVPAPDSLSPHAAFLVPRVCELVYTTYDMTPFARDMEDGGSPFCWDYERRAVIRAELDAFFFRLYGIDRDDVDYIMDTFPIVKRKDEEKYGTYRTKDLILDNYDRMAQAGISLDTPVVDGENFTSDLTPPPGHGPRHEPA
ncbi:hypothetical protein GCM10022402_27890 [Salinactinospora qingdaonensis]|uniref:site-specific DNA-methyltransferase (adenine-specific) n=2 Tax=Salinactinospora qingdaonensis TaxID=702744 RepID=A0ABP7FTT8_9ACTN